MFRVAWIALAIGCHGSPAPSTTAPPPATGSSSQGNGSTGSFGSATATGSATTTTTTGVECEKNRCGPQLGMMSKLCSDGTTGGPTGRCLEKADKTCAWEVRACP